MKKSLQSCLLILCAAALFGCNDDSLENNNPQDDSCSKITCNKGESCTEGKCLCGNRICNDNESCKSGECIANETVEDPCSNIICQEDEYCSEGKCLCGDKVCNDDEICSDNTCVPSSPEETPCGIRFCSDEETCVDNECHCGNNICESGQSCKSGECIDNDDPNEDEEDLCNPACNTGELCSESGECVKQNHCKTECSENEFCSDKGTCEPAVDSCDNSCDEGLTCIEGKCLCGNKACTVDQTCKNNVCEWNDPCHDKVCPDNQICVQGNCKILAFDPPELDVMMSSLSSVLTVHKSGTSALTWSISDNLKDWMLMCKSVKEQDSYIPVLSASDLKNCIKNDTKAKTESIQFVGLSRTGHDLTLTATEGKQSAKGILHLKPYFDMDAFFNMKQKSVSTNRTLIYRNNQCPGNYNKTYNDSSETPNERKANLGGEGNKYGKKVFTEADTALIDKDIFEKYVKPKMLYKDGSYYGTRASVVAAARFLVLQFPYDIPYQMASLNWTGSARSHYIWTKFDEPGESLSQVGIYGLNLDTNAYNSKHKIILKNVVPWGAEYKKTNDKDNDRPYHFNGLKCSGFVTWSFRNGRLGLGSWNSSMMANQGFCDKKDKRNFRCKELIYNTTDNPKWGKTTQSNQNNSLNAAFSKLGKLDEGDFIRLNDLSESEIKAVFKDIKAGDLLWRGKFTDDSHKNTQDGHIAMIIGIKRSKGEVTEIEVGEAIKGAGNTLNRHTPKGFTSTRWVKGNQGKYGCDSYVIKMDNVYNYYSDKHNITTKSEKSECPDGKKSGGNCYMYTDTYNNEFNTAIVTKTL